MGRRLLIGAGAINTTKLVLTSLQGYQSKLRLLDNPLSLIPFVSLSMLGSPLEKNDGAYPQATVIFQHEEDVYQGSFYGTSGPLRTDLVCDFPFSLKSSLLASKILTPAMGLLMLYYPGKPKYAATISLKETGELSIEGDSFLVEKNVERKIIKLFRSLGLFTSSYLVKNLSLGSGIHYAGTLPMKENPGPFETDSFGKVYSCNRVFVIDSACFPSLPAKNLTLTIMANAMRIADYIKKAFQNENIDNGV